MDFKLTVSDEIVAGTRDECAERDIVMSPLDILLKAVEGGWTHTCTNGLTVLEKDGEVILTMEAVE